LRPSCSCSQPPITRNPALAGRLDRREVDRAACLPDFHVGA
jgi:hypothetical protein